MNSFQPVFLFFAVLATACIMGIGIFIAERSPLGIIFSIIGLLVTMGAGFMTKKRMREKGEI
jgi:arginine exporter protein ArgO